MAFRVRTTQQADEDAAEILDWLMSHDAGDSGIRWFLELDDAMASLADLPHRCRLARESLIDIPFEVRQLLFGRKPNVYRILFTIEGDNVYILHIRHGRRAPLSIH